MAPKIDLTGRQFGFLNVIGPAPPREDRRTRWICQCACGRTKEIMYQSLKKGQLACGCQSGRPAHLMFKTPARVRNRKKQAISHEAFNAWLTSKSQEK